MKNRKQDWKCDIEIETKTKKSIQEFDNLEDGRK